jgi:hypothetical protein
MSNTITSSAGATMAPDLVLGYATDREAGTIAHDIIGRAEPDYTLRPALSRSGTLSLWFTGEQASYDAARALAAAATFTLVSDERLTINMRFIVPEGGRISRELDDDTRDTWTVDVDYREIAA